MAPINDYGMKVSRQGYDVNTCSDDQLLWSSSFKMPVVLFSGQYTISSPTVTQTIFTHNLGYYPAYFCFIQQDTDRVNQDVTNIDVSGKVFMDSTKLWYNQNEFSVTTKVTFFIFNIDLETAYTAPIVSPTQVSSSGTSNDYGFKVSNEGKDVNTAGLADLASFSGASLNGNPVQHQIIHKVGVGTVGNGVQHTVAHGLGYKPMFISYIKHATNGYFITSVVYDFDGVNFTQKWRTWADATNINTRNDTGGSRDFAYVVFKDPLL